MPLNVQSADTWNDVICKLRCCSTDRSIGTSLTLLNFTLFTEYLLHEIEIFVRHSLTHILQFGTAAQTALPASQCHYSVGTDTNSLTGATVSLLGRYWHKQPYRHHSVTTRSTLCKNSSLKARLCHDSGACRRPVTAEGHILLQQDRLGFVVDNVALGRVCF